MFQQPPLQRPQILQRLRQAGFEDPRHLAVVAVRPSEGFGDHFIHDPETEEILAGELEGTGRLVGVLLVLPENARTTFRTDDRVDGILEHVHLVAHAQGRYLEAERFYKDGLAGFKNERDPRAASFTLGFLSATLQALGKYDEVEQLLQDSLDLTHETGDRMAQGTILHHLGQLTRNQGSLVKAQQLLQESVTLFREIGDRWSLARALNDLAQTALLMGQVAEAHAHFQAVVKTAMETEMVPVFLDALIGLAEVHRLEGDSATSWELVNLVLTHPASSQEAKDRAGQIQTELAQHAASSPTTITSPSDPPRTLEQVIAAILKT